MRASESQLAPAQRVRVRIREVGVGASGVAVDVNAHIVPNAKAGPSRCVAVKCSSSSRTLKTCGRVPVRVLYQEQKAFGRVGVSASRGPRGSSIAAKRVTCGRADYDEGGTLLQRVRERVLGVEAVVVRTWLSQCR